LLSRFQKKGKKVNTSKAIKVAKTVHNFKGNFRAVQSGNNYVRDNYVQQGITDLSLSKFIEKRI
jgi:hypothetical protein